ncbi:MAG: cation diffusion facilitator family transporter [Fulvimonas sp.]|jgi:cobalt-zinc-cadmium efflux system protein|nr:cation diffusion facilitator family transporter [Fulvimonas sp.]
MSSHHASHAHHRHASTSADEARHRPHAGSRRPGRLLAALALTAAMTVFEVIGGWWSGSLALLADAGHMLVDTLGLLLAVVGAWLAARPADARRSYGYGRLEVLAGFVNALLQFVLVGFIVWEAIGRLLHLDAVRILSGPMLLVALAGLAVNLLVLRILHGHAHDDVNTGAAALHVLGDLLGSIAAVLAALAVRWGGWTFADPVLSLLVALLILGSAWRLLRRASHILLEGVPEGLDTTELASALHEADAAIRDVHHVHVWQLASGARIATLHVRLAGEEGRSRALSEVHRMLRDRFGIRHATVQVDDPHCPDDLPGHDPHRQG